MEIKVRLFATLRQQAEWSEKDIEVPESTTIHSLLQIVEGLSDDLELSNRAVYAAVNKEYADKECVLRNGDEVALFPPVSGGVSSTNGWRTEL